MARINVEDSLYQDRRFFDLIMKLGDVDKALGSLVRAWCVAQKWYLRPEKGIPEKEWEKQSLPKEIIEVGLAQRIDGFVFVSGADEQFAWLLQKIEAGRRGGRAKASAAKHPLAGAKRKLAAASGGYPPTPTPTLPLSSFSSSSSSFKNHEISLCEIPTDKKSGQLFVKTFMDSYKAKYGAYPPLTGFDKGVVKRLSKDHPADRLCLWVQGYFQMPDNWFKAKGHNLDTFEKNLTKIAVAVDTGKERPGEANWWEGMEGSK